MRVLLLADAAFSRREHAFLRRIEIGLLGEGWRVLRAVPEASAAIQPEALTRVAVYREHTSRFGRKAATQRFVEGLRDASPMITPDQDGALFEVVHAFGEGCWDRAAATAASAGGVLFVELVSRRDLRSMRAFERTVSSNHPGVEVRWCAPNARFYDAALEALPEANVTLTPWGVHTPDHAHAPPIGERAIAISVVCSGAEPRAIPPVIEALGALGERRERAMLFVDAMATESVPGLWSIAEERGVLDQVTFVADMESRREIILETDVLAIPEQMGELRTILLDAMAGAMLVVSRRDPLIEATTAQGVAMLLDAPTVGAWTDAFNSILDDPNIVTAFGGRARDCVREDRPVHRHIGAIIKAYESTLAPRSLPLRGTDATD